jgi:topoisomerase-4 subunit A
VKVVDEPVTVVVSEKGWVRARKGHGRRRAVRLQGRRCAVRRLRVPQRRHAGRARQQRPRLQRGRSRRCPAGAATALPVTTLIDLEAGTQGKLVDSKLKPPFALSRLMDT